MKFPGSRLSTTRHAAVVFCMVLVVVTAVSAQTQTSTKSAAQPAKAQQCTPVNIYPSCGTSLNSDNTCYTLMKDVRCTCTSPLIAIDFPGAGGILNLNGHTISCCNKSPGSIGIHLGAVGDQILGPGTITNCDTGIGVDYDLNTISSAHLLNNNTGISEGYGGNTITANILRHNSCTGIASASYNGSDYDFISNNLIVWTDGPISTTCPLGGVGINLGAGGGLAQQVSGNAVNHNAVGLYVETNTGVQISGNDVSNNSLQGAYMYFTDGAWVSSNVFNNSGQDGLSVQGGQSLTISGNFFERNGQDGLALDSLLNSSLYPYVIQGNFAYSNKRRGIALTNSSSTSSTPVFTSNVALGNAKFDLYECNSPNYVWTGNTCDKGDTQSSEFTCAWSTVIGSCQ